MKKREGEREIKPEFLKEIATRERSPKLKGERREKERARLEIFSFSAVVKARVFKFIHEGKGYSRIVIIYQCCFMSLIRFCYCD